MFAFGSIGSAFEYGVTDCHMFALRCLDEMTGGCEAMPLLRKYHDLRGGLRLVMHFGRAEEFLAARGCYAVQAPRFGDFVIYDRLDGVDEWPLTTPALSVGGDRVMLPIRALGIGVVPMWAPGHIQTILRVPSCPKQS